MPVSTSQPHPLDHPVWNALVTRHTALAEGGALARRYPRDITPFAAMTDASPQSFAALHALLSRSDQVVLFTPRSGEPSRGFQGSARQDRRTNDRHTCGEPGR